MKDCKLTGSICSEDTNVTSFRRRRLLGVHRPSATMTADLLSLSRRCRHVPRSPADPFVAMRRSEDERSGKRTFLALVSRIARHRVYHRPRRGARPFLPHLWRERATVVPVPPGVLTCRSPSRSASSRCPLSPVALTRRPRPGFGAEQVGVSVVCASLFRPTWAPG